MVPTFALSFLPLMPRPGVAPDDLPPADGTFAAVLAALGKGDPTAPPSFAPDVAMAVPTVKAQEAGADTPAPEADPWAEGAWPEIIADDVAPDMLFAAMPGQMMVPPSRLVPLLSSDPEAPPPSPALRSEPATPQAWATILTGQANLAPANRDLPETIPASAWAAQVAAQELGKDGQTPPLLSASEPAAMTGLATESPRDETALPTKAASAVADERTPFATGASGSVANAPLALSPTLPMRVDPVLDAPPPSRGPETAPQSDPITLASPQTAPQFQPMREGVAILTAAPTPLLPPERLSQAQAGQTAPPAMLHETAAPPISPYQNAAPIPAVGLGAPTQAFVPQNPDHPLGQARHLAADKRETPTETDARPTDQTSAAPPPSNGPSTGPSTGAETLRPLALGQMALERPSLPDSTAETRAILRQLAPSDPDQDGAVEIALFPKGLGQVKLDIQHGPDGARIIVSADRPETLDLIRRHSADLVAEFRAAGMANPVVSFAPVDAGQPIQPPQRPDSAALLAGGGFGSSSKHMGGSPQGQSSPRQDSPLATEPPDLTPPPYRSEVVPRGGLILRL